MKLKNRFSLFAVLIFSVIIIIASAVIYVSFYKKVESQEFQSLESKTLLAAIYYLEKDEIPSSEHESIKSKLLKTISRSNIIVYDSLGNRFDGEMRNDVNIHRSFVDYVARNGTGRFESDKYFYSGLYYNDNQGDFVIVTRESKEDFNTQMTSLLNILTIVSISGVLLIFIFAQILGNIAYNPIFKIIRQIQERDSKNFHEPIVINKSYTEVETLVNTYNHFVERIAETFSVQKNFIDYVSHELRTPITALLVTMDVTNRKERTNEEYEDVIRKLKQYTIDLEETLEQMMILSGANQTIEVEKIRIDEVLWHIIEEVTQQKRARINVNIEVEDESLFTITGNEKLLQVAINNIIGNAIKYSDNKPVKVALLEEHNKLKIRIHDAGIGISEKDLSKITQNFYRGENTHSYQGKGIGLSLANIIFKLHKIDMKISSNGDGTTVLLSF
jgi:two-component system sensor histidine kinase ArlS